jgi:hypothetical protein
MELEKVKLFNGDAIESVNVIEGEQARGLVYKKEKKFFLCKRKAGFYTDYSGHYYGTSDDLFNGSYRGSRVLVRDNKAYWRPFVEIKMISGDSTKKNFDTIEECNKYATDIMDIFIPKQFKVNKD